MSNKKNSLGLGLEGLINNPNTQGFAGRVNTSGILTNGLINPSVSPVTSMAPQRPSSPKPIPSQSKNK